MGTFAVYPPIDLNSIFSDLGSLLPCFESSKFIAFLNNEGYENLLNLKTAPILPNQNEDFKIKDDLFLDVDIEEELKNILKILDKDKDWREILIHKNIEEKEKVLRTFKNQDNIIDEINKILEENKNVNSDKAISYLISLFSNDTEFPVGRTTIYDYCKEILKDEIPEKKVISKWTNQIWKQCDNLTIGRLVKTVAEQKNIKTLSSYLNIADNSQTVQWVDKFIAFLNNEGYESQLNLITAPILPNQNGNFKVKDDLFLDDGEIDETIKDIAESLGYECREELLDIIIPLDLPTNRIRTQKQIADEIKERIKPLLSEVPKKSETKQIFKELCLWFNKNKTLAEAIFEDLYKSRHMLRDDDEVAEDMYKASQFDELMHEFGIKDPDELRRLIKSGIGKISEKEDKPKFNIASEEFLLRFGITSHEELLEALKDKNIAQSFVHNSNPSVEMFEYVMRTIERAKNRVREYLETQVDYDCSEWNEVIKTCIGGVKKFERPINIVVRPSDRGQVIFYYSSEKDVLKKTNSELWIENGLSQPEHLTLGKILFKNRIDRIDV